MKNAIVLAIALAMPMAAAADEKLVKMDAAAIEKTVRVSSQGAEGVNLTFLFMTAMMFAAALSGGSAPVVLAPQ